MSRCEGCGLVSADLIRGWCKLCHQIYSVALVQPERRANLIRFLGGVPPEDIDERRTATQYRPGIAEFCIPRHVPDEVEDWEGEILVLKKREAKDE